MRVGVSVNNRVGVRVEVGVGEGVIVQVTVTVQVGMRVSVAAASITAWVVAVGGAGVFVGSLIISVGGGASLPGADQIAGPLTCTMGVGSKSSLETGPASRRGNSKNRLMLANPCASVTPIKERVFSTTRLKINPTKKIKMRSSQER